MNPQSLENLARIGELKKEPSDPDEIEGLIHGASVRLVDALNSDLSIESRFDLAYNVAHALALAALRWCGYRSGSRYLVFQCLPHTLGLGEEHWRVLAVAHRRRNLVEYEGRLELDERLVSDVTKVAREMLHRVQDLVGSRRDPGRRN